ncbi:carotenoid ester lipase precursor [Earliella scabrosa]|nr:carotenoid ester lipase precursor [Earliella scabrosa]
MLLTGLVLSATALLHIPFASALEDGPTVRLDEATVIGTRRGSVESYLGIPFAQSTTDELRLALPKLLASYNRTINATTFGNQCIQQPLLLEPNVPPELLQDVAPLVSAFTSNPDVPQSEDCLNLNVIRPANISAETKLPVLFWIHGGGFALGSNAITTYNGSAVVQRSIDIGEPIIFVAINYRLNVFGFLGGEEVREAGLGNLGLHDQRAALRWVRQHISAFGGDPTKVTIWGESAGSISVALQMLTNNGDPEGLFRAGIMSSGSLVPTGDITDLQGTYDLVVDQVGCSGASDTLACLRTVSSDSLLVAANMTPSLTSFGGLAIPYMPRADGVFIPEPIHQLARDGALAQVPFIIGDVKDEGTLFSLGSFNITTDAEFADYIAQVWFPGASESDLALAIELYPSDPAAGSPFDTGDAYAFSPEYKRIAALQGDWFFHAPRRELLNLYSATQPTYNYLSARGSFPGVGDVHGSDLLIAFGPGDITNYLVRFVNDLDPNEGSDLHWPLFNVIYRATLQLDDGDTPLEITADVQRMNGTDELFQLSSRFPF